MTIVLLHRELDDSVLLSDGHESRKKKKTNQGHDQIVKKKKKYLCDSQTNNVVQKKKQEKRRIDNRIAWLAQQRRSVKVGAVVRRIYSRLYRVSSNISRGARLKFCRRVRSRFFSDGEEEGGGGMAEAWTPARRPEHRVIQTAISCSFEWKRREIPLWLMSLESKKKGEKISEKFLLALLISFFLLLLQVCISGNVKVNRKRKRERKKE